MLHYLLKTLPEDYWKLSLGILLVFCKASFVGMNKCGAFINQRIEDFFEC
jgi:hypothetical protein